MYLQSASKYLPLILTRKYSRISYFHLFPTYIFLNFYLNAGKDLCKRAFFSNGIHSQ